MKNEYLWIKRRELPLLYSFSLFFFYFQGSVYKTLNPKSERFPRHSFISCVAS